MLTPLGEAFKTQNYEIIKLVIEGKNILNQVDKSLIIHLICSDSNTELNLETKFKIIDLLLENGLNINQVIVQNYKTTPLMYLINNENCKSTIAMYEFLISRGAHTTNY